MKTRKSYTAPDMKVMQVGTEQILAGSPTDIQTNSKNNIDLFLEETDAEGAAKHTSIWEDE